MERVEGRAVDVDLADAGVALVHLDGVGAVVLDGHPELAALDAQRGVLADQRPPNADGDRQNAVIGFAGVEVGRQGRVDVIALNPQGAAAAERHRFAQPTGAALPQLLEQPQGGAGVAADLVRARLLGVELLHHDERQHDLVLVEAEQRPRVGQQHAGVQDIGGSCRHPRPSPVMSRGEHRTPGGTS